MSTENSSFPPDFVWGAATASYQIEGAAHEDGRGESVWDRFCATPGKVRNGDTGDVACDFYHRYRDDIALMRELGLDAFRFSIAWPRVLPTGRGRSTRPGSTSTTGSSTSCSRTTSSRSRRSSTGTRRRRSRTRAAGRRARPQRRSSSTRKPSRDGSATASRHWMTHNEPWVHAWIGHSWGEHAPGRTSEARRGRGRAPPAALARLGGRGDPARSRPDAQVGITLNLAHAYPASDSPEDEAAAWRVDGEGNRWFLDPIFRGCVSGRPARAQRARRAVRPATATSRRSPRRSTSSASTTTSASSSAPATTARAWSVTPRAQHTDMGWEVYPDGLHQLLVRVANDYAPRGDLRHRERRRVRRRPRPRRPTSTIPSAPRTSSRTSTRSRRAVADGVPVKGYFVWSLLDNFEWAYGYSKRFGIVYVDYPTLERVPKDSFYWYRDFIATRARTPRPSPIATS